MDESVYLVITHYSYDTDMPIEVFKTEEEAKKFLEDDFNGEIDYLLNECEIEKEYIKTDKDDDGWYARLINDATWGGGDPPETIDWTIVEMKQSELIP